MDLSVVIITKNEANNIAGALESVSWASDVVVVDSGSTDWPPTTGCCRSTPMSERHQNWQQRSAR